MAFLTPRTSQWRELQDGLTASGGERQEQQAVYIGHLVETA